jgi:hypothetical protein
MKLAIARAAFISIVAGCAADTAGPATFTNRPSLAEATRPQHFAMPFPEEPIFLQELSGTCGFDVFLTFDGIARGILFFDRDGKLIGEVDAGGVLKVSLTSASASLTCPLAALHLTYHGDAEGHVTVGSTATVTITGFSLNPVIPTSGRAVFDGVVIEITSAGVPLVDFAGAPISFNGHPTEVQAICEALA